MYYVGLVDDFNKQHDIAELNAIEQLAWYWGTSRVRQAKMYPHFLKRVYGDEIPLPDARWIGLRAKYCRLNQPKYFPINWLSWLDLVYKP